MLQTEMSLRCDVVEALFYRFNPYSGNFSKFSVIFNLDSEKFGGLPFAAIVIVMMTLSPFYFIIFHNNNNTSYYLV